MDNATLQTVLRSLNHLIADTRKQGDPNGLLKGLIMARANVRSFVPQSQREVDLDLTDDQEFARAALGDMANDL